MERLIMSNVNDEKILELKAQIKEKKEKLKNKKKFVSVTNCSLEVDGVRYNLNVLSKEQLISLLVKLNSYKISAVDLGLLDTYMISGYKVEDWITDIRLKLEVVAHREEENKLQELESKLHVLLSNDKKVELELKDIEFMLK
jgi:hypothetical protein